MKSLDELKEIREQYKEILDLRMHASHKIEVKAEEGIGHKKKAVLVCGGTGCTSSGSRRVIERLKEEIKKQGLEEDVSVVMTGCFGLCALGPIMIVYPEGAFYSMVKEEEIPEIV